jgi:N-methylhydantoinase A
VEAARCILSGPAGGVTGARAVARQLGIERVMTFDMGGTSTDVSLIDGEPRLEVNRQVGGLPLNLPMLSIHTVGSGGGSIAFRDAGGGLQVGPQSTGANPGPACYGIGDLPTVTDANVLLGRIRPEFFFGGEMRLHPERAQAAFAKLAASISLEERACQLGVLRIVNAHMARALRVISVEKGKDPRDYDLFSFGGAGGLHAVELARQLGMRRIIVPRNAATLSALGMLMADAAKDYSRTVMLPGTCGHTDLQAKFDELGTLGKQDLIAQGFARASTQIASSADLRYAGQSFELNVPFSPAMIADFHRAHAAAYGYSDEDASVEIVNLRVRATGLVQIPSLPSFPAATKPLSDALLGTFDVSFESGLQPTPFYGGEMLAPGHTIAGPAIVVRKDTTVLIGEPDRAFVDTYLNLLIEVG